MSIDVKYRTSATATGGRDGQASTADGSLNVKLSLPKELGGAGGPGNNPEQLFAAGYAACFIGAMKAGSGGCRRDRNRRHWSALRGRIRHHRRPQSESARFGTRRCRSAHSRSASSLPVFKCNARQCRCRSFAGLTRLRLAGCSP
jgi:hypothetical protein